MRNVHTVMISILLNIQYFHLCCTNRIKDEAHNQLAAEITLGNMIGTIIRSLANWEIHHMVKGRNEY